MPSSRFLTALLAGLTAMTSLSIDMNLPALPVLKEEFGASVASVQLTLSLFLAGFAVGQLLCGPLSDRFGRRPILLGGLALFTVAAIACFTSQSLTMLVVCRMLQGAGASVGPIISRAIVRDHYDPSEGADVLSQITQIMVLGPILAPLIGGALLRISGWHAIFAALATAGLILGFLTWKFLPETRKQPELESRMVDDVRAGVVAVLRHKTSLRHMLTTCLSYAGMFAYVSSAAFVYMSVFKVSNGLFGLMFGMTAGGLMIGATLNRKLLQTHSLESLLRTGVLTMAGAGAALLACAFGQIGGPFGVLVPMVFYFVGVGLLMPNATALAMAPHGRLAGVASSFIGSFQTLCGAFAGFLVGLWFNGTTVPFACITGGLALVACLTFNHQAHKVSSDELKPAVGPAVASTEG